jgi:hypothetical protein
MVIFDFDGTLADSAAWMIRAVNPMARRFGFKTVTDDEIDMLRGRSTREVIRYLGISPWKLPMIAAHGKKMMAADCPLHPAVSRNRGHAEGPARGGAAFGGGQLQQRGRPSAPCWARPFRPDQPLRLRSLAVRQGAQVPQGDVKAPRATG